MCYIECQCHSVRIEFTAAEPRLTCECCCTDCRSRMEYTASVSGRALPEAFVDKTKATVANYLENNFEVVRGGRDKLRFFKLRVGGETINMACAECSSLLLVAHPFYNGHVVCTPGGDFSENETDIQDKPPTIRWFVKDWPEEKIEKLAPMPGFWLEDDGQPSGSEGWAEAFGEIMKQFGTPVESNDKRDTFEAILSNHKGGLEMADAGLGGTTKESPENPATAAA